MVDNERKKEENTPEKIKILYVDDEVNNLQSFKATFRREFDIELAESAAEGLKLLENSSFQIVLTDQRMPNMTGVEFLAKIKEKYSEAIRILITGYSDIEAVIEAINKGEIYKYITKPWDENDLRVTINNAMEVFLLREENKQLMKSLIRANEQLEFMLRQKLLS